MPYMYTDLSKVKGILTEDRIQFLVYQILCGLKVRPKPLPKRGNIFPTRHDVTSLQQFVCPRWKLKCCVTQDSQSKQNMETKLT